MIHPSYTFPRWIKIALMVVILTIVAGGARFYKVQETKQLRQVEDRLEAIARIKADGIAKWRADRLGDAAVLTGSPFFARHAAQFMDAPRFESAEELRNHFQVIRNHNPYSDILLVDPEGRTRLSLSEDMARCSEHADTLDSALSQRRPLFTDLHFGPRQSTPHLSVIAPLYVGEGQAQRPFGAVVLVCVASQFLYPLIKQWPEPSSSAETLLVEREGDNVLFLNELRHRSDTALKLRIPLNRTEVPAVKAVLGREGVVTGTDYRGVEVVAALVPVPDSPWFMVAKIDTAEAFAVWRFRSAMILSFLVSLVAFVSALWGITWQRNRKAYYRAIYHAEARLRASVERHSITLKSIGDGVISTDSRGRVELLNPVAETLTGWKIEEAAGRSLAEVFRIINEETREKVRDPVMRVLAEGVVVGLSNHTLLIARDGTERPITDSGAPIRDDAGGITGVVLIFRDQSAQRMTQRLSAIRLRLIEYAVARSLDELLAQALEEVCRLVQSPTGFYHFVEADQKTLSPRQWFTRTPKESCFAEGGQGHCKIDEAGVWEECVARKKPVIHNDAVSLPDRGGMPDGRAALVRGLAVPVIRKDRVVAVLGLRDKPVDYDEKDADMAVFLADVIWEIAEGKRREEILKDSEKRYRRLFESAKDGILILDADTGKVMDVNPFLMRLLGCPYDGLCGKPIWEIASFKDIVASRQAFDLLRSGKDIHYENIPLETGDGRRLDVEFTVTGYQVDHTKVIQCHIRDITEHLRLRAQFEQAQKMESVGRLAGGVAHDFNNMLSVILGHAEMAMGKVPQGQPVQADLEQIQMAARHSRDITRQLLAFARKQTIAPVVLRLDETVEGMLQTLRRLIGEDIDLLWRSEAGLWPVRIDPAQIDQILANLCVNARDAIADVGKITIEAENIVLDMDHCAGHAEYIPGEYVLLAVSDDGYGMDKETLARLFEPFFTTKGVGRGTGLGLATVYGIVKQNNGFINVHSEPGKGSTFRIHLPRYMGDMVEAKVQITAKTEQGRGETVLLVEDEESILRMIESMLARLGYEVLAVNDPVEAIALAAGHEGEIHLLMTDVVMPGMNGRDLSERILAIRPVVKCLFMSGYTANVIAHRGVLDEGVQFIQKPFSIRELALKVRSSLEGKG